MFQRNPCLELQGRRFAEVHVTLASLSFQSSVFELARLPDFADLAVIPEDAVHDRGASFTASQCDSVHVVVDRHLVTGQNEASTLTAVQNLVLLCNQRYKFLRNPLAVSCPLLEGSQDQNFPIHIQHKIPFDNKQTDSLPH